MRVVGCTRVKNGARWMRRWIDDMSKFCDFLCVLDDGSEDGTVAILDEAAKSNPKLFLHKQRALPRDGGRDCNVLYEMAESLKADWIFAPDADEFVDPEDFAEIRPLLETDRDDVLGWTFPFFYFWDDERHYRTDGDYANCHVIRLFRHDPKLRPPRRISHSQLCPDELDRRRIRVAPARMVHYGYMDRADRAAKHKFYTERDKDPIAAGAGVKTYDHIVAEAGVAIRPYPTREEWLRSDERTGWNVDRRMKRMGFRISAKPFPGALDGYFNDDILDEVVFDDADQVPSAAPFAERLGRTLRAMRPGGRLDIRALDLPVWARAFGASADEKERGELAERLVTVLEPLWEEKLRSALTAAGFERLERLPTPTLHIMAYKPNGETNA